MKSFEHGYLLETPISRALLMNMRALGEFRGRQALYSEQFPEVLEALCRAGSMSGAVERLMVGEG